MGAAFSVRLGNPVLEGLAIIGKYDGVHPSLTCATSGGRVMIHNNAQADAQGSADSAVQFLNFNKQPAALAAGAICAKKGTDTLLMGSQTTLIAYNVNNNTDQFYKEVADGVNAITVTQLAGSDQKIAVVGGNCSLLGFDAEGQERFWTVASDNVTALTPIPWTPKALNALLAGADDYEIRALLNEEVVCSVTECDKIMQLVATGQPNKFAFSLANGTVGIYDGPQRLWRFKSKFRVASIACCDVDFDGVPEVLSGWSNGKFDVRTDNPARKGECIFKDTLPHPVSAIVCSDYRREGRVVPLVCSYDGEVRGYVAMETQVEEAVESQEQELLERLMQEKQTLKFDINSLEQQLDKAKKGQQDSNLPAVEAEVTCALRPNQRTRSIELVLQASAGAVIRSAIVTGELIFNGNESAFFYAEEPSSVLVCPLQLQRDVASELTVVAMVGNNMSETFQVYDIKFRLPKFAMFVPVKELQREPDGFVKARLSERPSRVAQWMSSAFTMPMRVDSSAQTVDGKFVSLRDGTEVFISWTAGGGGELVVRSNSVDICGEIIQDLGAALNISELQSTADFPQEFAAFAEVLRKVDEYNAVRMKLSAEMADSTQLVKALVIKAEDARILSDMRLMKRMYGSLYEVNRELIGEYMKRSNNHNELLAALKEMNTMIQRAGKLRIGAAKTALITECRNAIKESNTHMLFKIMQVGTAA